MKSIADIFRSYAVFNSQGVHINGTDKQSNHLYGDAYESLFHNHFGFGCDSRNCVQLMMEVGVADGSSLLAWRDIFPNATIVGMDIHHSDRAHGERIEFHLGDQRSQKDCERVADKRQFDVIVEDATHWIGDTLLTLLWLWPFVKPNGLYVIEDFPNYLLDNIRCLFPCAQIVDTTGPFGGYEPLVVLKKPPRE